MSWFFEDMKMTSDPKKKKQKLLYQHGIHNIEESSNGVRVVGAFNHVISIPSITSIDLIRVDRETLEGVRRMNEKNMIRKGSGIE